MDTVYSDLHEVGVGGREAAVHSSPEGRPRTPQKPLWVEEPSLAETSEGAPLAVNKERKFHGRRTCWAHHHGGGSAAPWGWEPGGFLSTPPLPPEPGVLPVGGLPFTAKGSGRVSEATLPFEWIPRCPP